LHLTRWNQLNVLFFTIIIKVFLVTISNFFRHMIETIYVLGWKFKLRKSRNESCFFYKTYLYSAAMKILQKSSIQFASKIVYTQSTRQKSNDLKILVFILSFFFNF
jgi:hypothetical protein